MQKKRMEETCLSRWLPQSWLMWSTWNERSSPTLSVSGK